MRQVSDYMINITIFRWLQSYIDLYRYYYHCHHFHFLIQIKSYIYKHAN